MCSVSIRGKTMEDSQRLHKTPMIMNKSPLKVNMFSKLENILEFRKHISKIRNIFPKLKKLN